MFKLKFDFLCLDIRILVSLKMQQKNIARQKEKLETKKNVFQILLVVNSMRKPKVRNVATWFEKNP